MASQGPMAGHLDENGNVVPSLAALLKHAAIHNTRNAEWHGAPYMPLEVQEHDAGRYCIIFGHTGFQEMSFSEAWRTIYDLSVGWTVGYKAGCAS